jgi:hypothetical protein
MRNRVFYHVGRIRTRKKDAKFEGYSNFFGEALPIGPGSGGVKSTMVPCDDTYPLYPRAFRISAFRK